MKILLLGEFSRLHNTLKEGLEEIGHEVLLVGSGDGFKNYKVDVNIRSKIKSNKTLNFFNSQCIKFFKIDFIKIENAYRFNKIIQDLKGYDIVQLINEDALFINPKRQIKFLKKIISQNQKLFLLCCGNDYLTVKYALEERFRYSVLTPYIKNPSLKKKFVYALKYTTPSYKALHDFIFKNIEGVIASDMDYHIPMQEHREYLGLIPNPININKIAYNKPKIETKINIFLGINTHSKIKKGVPFFEKALAIIQEKYPEKVIIKITENLPYKDYIKVYDEAHILLDQVYAYDQGYNALEAMAKGKVVFTGAEQEWLEYYNLKEDSIAINALPDVDYLVRKLEWLILNPEKIIEISKNTRAFIEREHDYVKSSEKYLEKWQL